MRRILGQVFALAFAISVIAVQPGKTQSRVPLVSDHPDNPGLAKFFDQARGGRGQILNFYRLIGNSPSLALAFFEYARKLRDESIVSRQYRELLILRTTQQVADGRYQYSHHVALALSCGVSQAQVDALAHWRTSKAFSPKERAILAFSDGMESRLGPDKATYEKLASFFGPREIVELALTDGFYLADSKIAMALGLELEEDAGSGASPNACR